MATSHTSSSCHSIRQPASPTPATMVSGDQPHWLQLTPSRSDPTIITTWDAASSILHQVNLSCTTCSRKACYLRFYPLCLCHLSSPLSIICVYLQMFVGLTSSHNIWFHNISVIMYFSDTHASWGYSSFWHSTHTIHMAFLLSFVYLKAQVHPVFEMACQRSVLYVDMLHIYRTMTSKLVLQDLMVLKIFKMLGYFPDRLYI